MEENKTVKTDNRSTLNKKNLTAKNIAIIAVVLVVAIIAFGLGSGMNSDQKTTSLGFKNIGELATQAAYCTEVEVMDSSRELYGIKIPFTQSKYIFSYDIEIKAGVNFSEIDYTVEENIIKVKLPEVKILSNSIVEGSFKVYHEKESVFRQISLSETDMAREELMKNAEKDAIANGLLDNARKNAEVLITSFFGREYNLDEYTVEFVDTLQ